MTQAAPLLIEAGASGAEVLPRQSETAASAQRLVTEVVAIDAQSDFSQLSAGLHRTPFQSPVWLAAWFRAFAEGSRLDHDQVIEGFWLSISRGGLTLLAMPLIRRRVGRLRVLEMPDLGVSDYAAPLLATTAILAAHDATEIWAQILNALPEADLLNLERCPAMIEGIANPLIDHPAALPSRISGWARPLPADRAALRAGLSAGMREKLGKAGRRFERISGSRIGRIRDVTQVSSCLATLSHWQAERMDATGRTYELDEPLIATFYDRLAHEGITGGDVIMMELAAEGESRALNFAFRDMESLVYLRIGNEFGKWTPLSLGILATEAAIIEGIAEGARRFDFGAGDYEYKLRFGGRRMPLFDIVLPLSLAGLPHVLALQARRRLSRLGWLRRAVETLRGLRARRG